MSNKFEKIFNRNMKIFLGLVITLVFTLVFISCEKEVFTGPIATKEVQTQYGKLFIDSNPKEALIYIDGKNTGYVTPDTIKWLEAGSYKVTLSKGMYGDTSFVVNIKSNEKTEILIDFRYNPGANGFLYCSSKPTGAKIFINDEDTHNVTQFFFLKPPGEYNIKFTYPEHRADSTFITLFPKQNKFVNMTLEDTSKWVSYNTSNSILPSNQITSIAVDKNNQKWIGTQTQGVARFNEKEWVVYNSDNSSIKSNFINCIKTADDNSVWVGTTRGLSVYKDGIWSSFSEDFLNKNIYGIAIGKNNEIWVATFSGLAKYYAGTWQIFNTSNSQIGNDSLTCVDVDSRGRVWMGTYLKGVYMFDGTNWFAHNVGGWSDLEFNTIDMAMCVAVDKNDNVWVERGILFSGGIANYLSKFDGNEWKKIFYPGVNTSSLNSIYVDENNTKWFGTITELVQVSDQGSVTIYNSQNSQIPPGKVTCTVLDLNKRTWIGTAGNGITKYKK